MCETWQISEVENCYCVEGRLTIHTNIQTNAQGFRDLDCNLPLQRRQIALVIRQAAGEVLGPLNPEVAQLVGLQKSIIICQHSLPAVSGYGVNLHLLNFFFAVYI
jgi:ribulose kinase